MVDHDVCLFTEEISFFLAWRWGYDFMKIG